MYTTRTYQVWMTVMTEQNKMYDFYVCAGEQICSLNSPKSSQVIFILQVGTWVQQ